MPELPEVETVCRTLEPQIKGARIEGVAVRQPQLRWRVDTERLSATILGQSVIRVTRRAKYILIMLTGESCLLIHLGMTGRLTVVPTSSAWAKHDHIAVNLGSERQLRFNDARRFGSVDVCRTDELLHHPRLVHLGPEPLGEGFSGDVLYGMTRKSRQPIKQFIMDAKRVVGVGNIYACEALFLVGIHPKARAGRIGRERCDKLTSVIRQVLQDSIERGGTTIKDFENAAGEPGAYGQDLLVYGREREECGRCAGEIRRIVQAGRSTFYCPGCQFV